MFYLIKINDKNFPTQKKNRIDVQLGIYRQYPRESDILLNMTFERKKVHQYHGLLPHLCRVQMCLIKKNLQNIEQFKLYIWMMQFPALHKCLSVCCMRPRVHMIFIQKKKKTTTSKRCVRSERGFERIKFIKGIFKQRHTKKMCRKNWF